MRRLRVWGPVVLWMAVIFVFSARERIIVADQELYNFLFFKFLHLCEYALLFILYFRALKNTFPNNAQRTLLSSAFALTIAYAFTDELHQTFVPTREGRLRDVIIDGIGAGIAWISITTLLPKAPPRLQRLAQKWLLL